MSIQLETKGDEHQETKVDPVEVDVEQVGEHDKRDAVFGQLHEDGPNYRGLTWIGAVIIMIKSQIGLGVLSIPFLLQTMGMIPGVLVFLTIGLFQTWCNWTIGTFKLRHPDIYGIDDLGYRMGGRWGREFAAFSMVTYYTVCTGSGILACSIALNAMSTHGTCTAAFVAVSALMALVLASIQTLNKMSWAAWGGTASIFVAVFTMTIAVGVQDRPALAPQVGPWDKNLLLTNAPAFAAVGSALGGMTFTLATSPAFFAIVSEMKDPRRYGSAVIVCHTVILTVDIVVAVVVYYFCGQYVASPAPGSAGVLMKKVVFGLGFFGILMTTVVLAHYPAKYLFVRLLRGSEHLSNNSFRHWATWLSCTTGLVSLGYLVASAIPIFSSLSSLVGAMFGPLISFQPISLFYIYDIWWKRTDRSLSVKIQGMLAMAILVLGTFVQIAGSYGAISDIIDGFRTGNISRPWSCDDNSNSV